MAVSYLTPVPLVHYHGLVYLGDGNIVHVPVDSSDRGKSLELPSLLEDVQDQFEEFIR